MELRAYSIAKRPHHPKGNVCVNEMAFHSEKFRLAMATFFPPLSFTGPLVDDSVSTRSPSPVDYDNSSGESDSELLLSLFGHPEPGSSPTEDDRGGRPFPYTRSKTRWRKRPNDELKYLRAQIVELEGLVATLNHSGPRPKLLGNGEDSSDNQVEALQKLSKESHKKKIEAAWAENRKLKAMVASHFQIAKSLQAALDENMRLRARKVCWPSSAAASDELVFALLDEEKELQYAATDKILDASGIAQIYHPYFSEPEIQRDESGIFFQHNDVRVLPFSVDDVVRALRYSLRHGSSVGPSQHCRKFLMQDAYSRAVTVDNVEIPGTLPAEIKGRHFLWSVVKPDRTVINWSSFNEYDGAKHIRLLKRLWFSVEPIVLHSGPTSQGCVLRTIVRFTPVDPETSLKDIEEMADVIISGYKRDSVRVVMAVREQLAARSTSIPFRTALMTEEFDRGGRPYPYTRSKTRWRKRPTDELKYLKAQVIELESLLAALSHGPRLLNYGSTGMNMTTGNQEEMLQNLRRESQLNKLKAAMKENQNLRNLLARKFQLARSLQSRIDEEVRLGVRKISWPTRTGASNELVFALLDEEKERQFSVVDQVLVESGIARIYHQLFSSLQFHSDGNVVSFQHNEVRMIPFGVADVARSIRHGLSFGARVGPTKHCRDIRMYDSYFHAVTADSINIPDTEPAEVNSRVLQLCVTQNERTVITWSSYVEYKGSRFIRMLEKTWIVLEPIPLETLGVIPMGDRTHGTLMRVVVRLTPVETDLDPQNPEHVLEMSNVVVNTYRRHGQRMYQAMLEQLSSCMQK
ncbi:hypothetical protein P3T76_011211 [Phytophthora citrophthora]|uniref:START domain-containing protein n=1 Tax=Phytophthora citrophthora TaxID=4793 RepID=A0AAD9GA80_9STRA|nr:hypothetical protein P3T76_011211 [Phytophthora citrophthora]